VDDGVDVVLTQQLHHQGLVTDVSLYEAMAVCIRQMRQIL
jgi:hypothetical protein